MRTPTRRTVLGALSGGIAATSGCVHGCGASGPRRMDDVLRVTGTSVRRIGSGYRFEVIVVQPGPDSLEYDRDRNAFNSEYEGVRVAAYTIDGDVMARERIGDFEPGESKRRTFETDSFPHFLTASFNEVSGAYDGRCTVPDHGTDLRIYLGNHPDGLSDRARNFLRIPDRRRNGSLPGPPTGHLWYPMQTRGERDIGQDPAVSKWDVEDGICAQRIVSEFVPAGDGFEILPSIPDYLDRSETYRVTVYRSRTVAPETAAFGEVSVIPDTVRRVHDSAEWDAEGTDGSVSASLTRDEFERLYATIDEQSDPEMFSYLFDRDEVEYATSENHFPGHCQEGMIRLAYEIEFETERRPVVLLYRWDGPPAPGEVGETPTSTTEGAPRTPGTPDK